MFLAAIYALLSFGQIALCALQFQHPDDLPQIDYHFIVIGGGTAGVVVGSRLGEVRHFNVLIIEAGPSNDEVFDSKVPGLSLDLGFGTQFDWNYTTTPQIDANGKVSSYGRAMMLGGCSSHNEMVYTRGSRDDYDRWASTVKDENLSWNKILKYIFKAERWSSPNDPSLPETNHFNESLHNTGGKIGVTAPYYNHPFNDLLFEAARELSDEFPFLLDLNNGRPIGVGWGQATIANGTRSSSATSYVPQTGDNVHILLNTRVTRVLPTSDLDGSNGKGFRKVEFALGRDGPKYTLTAQKEVIVSGGVINTPQILLNSGIGPRDELEAVGVETLIDNPSVGKNFTDQISVLTTFATNLPLSDFDQTAALAEWKRDHTGRLALAFQLSPIGWVRFPTTADPFKDGSRDPTGGPNSPHVELFFLGTAAEPVNASVQSDISLFTNVVNLNPVSRGSIRLSTTNPFDAPVIDPALLTSSLDTSILLEGIMSTQRLFSSNAFSKSVFAPNIPSSNGTLTKDDIIKFIKTNAQPFLHGTGSCGIAPHGANWGVVDPQFQVRGVRGLRIVDASVIPFVTSGHIQAAVYAIAEWASDIIKRTYQGVDVNPMI